MEGAHLRWGEGVRGWGPLMGPVWTIAISCPRNKECPTCRKKLVSKRSLRPDPNFDALISKIYPSREEYEAHQDRVLIRLSRLHNQQALSSSIEEGLRMQAMHRCRGQERGCSWPGRVGWAGRGRTGPLGQTPETVSAAYLLQASAS